MTSVFGVIADLNSDASCCTMSILTRLSPTFWPHKYERILPCICSIIEAYQNSFVCFRMGSVNISLMVLIC